MTCGFVLLGLIGLWLCAWVLGLVSFKWWVLIRLFRWFGLFITVGGFEVVWALVFVLCAWIVVYGCTVWLFGLNSLLC